MAEHLHADLVIMDDEDELGKRLLKKKRLARISTAQLVLEMVAGGALDQAQGLTAFNLASNNASTAVFARDCVSAACSRLRPGESSRSRGILVPLVGR